MWAAPFFNNMVFYNPSGFQGGDSTHAAYAHAKLNDFMASNPNASSVVSGGAGGTSKAMRVALLDTCHYGTSLSYYIGGCRTVGDSTDSEYTPLWNPDKPIRDSYVADKGELCARYHVKLLPRSRLRRP